MSFKLKHLPFWVGFVSLFLGSVGFHSLFPENTIQTSVYQAAQLFTISSGAISGTLPWTLEAARWLAPIATLGAILVAAQAFFYAFQARLKSWLYRDHTILCGVGDRGLAIASRLKGQGKQVIVIDTNEESINAKKIRTFGIPLFIGDALDDKIIRIAGAKRANRVIATCGSDEVNLRIAGNLEGKTGAEIIAAIEKPSLRILFRDRLGAGKNRQSVRMVGFQFRAAKRIFYSLAESLCTQLGLAEKGLHVFLEIKSDLLEDFVRAAVLILQISGRKKPTFTVHTKDQTTKDTFLSRYPGVSLVADLHWVSSCPSQSAAPAVFDVAIFCCEDDMTTFERAELFSSLSLCPPPNICACLQKPANLNFFQATGFSVRGDFQIIDLVDFSLGGRDPLDGHLENKAIQLHHEYVERERQKDPSWDRLPTDWRYLDEGYRESNRLQAANLELTQIAWKACPKDRQGKLLEQLTQAEHMRWMADKVMHGWRWSGSLDPSSRDEKRRLHHLLVPFEELTEEEKHKDFLPLKNVLSS